MMKALVTFLTNYITINPDKIMNYGVVVLGMAKFAGFIIGKLSAFYHNKHLYPITEFEIFFREYAETSEQMFLKKQERASGGEG